MAYRTVITTAVISTTVTASVTSAARTTEAMTAPSVMVAPLIPGTHTEEDAVIEVAGAVKA
jgi:hypothetical protein